MGGLRGCGEERVQRYKMQEKLVTIGDDYWIENEAGKKVFYLDGKALRVRNTLIIKNSQGKELYKLREKLLHVRDMMDFPGQGHDGYSKCRR